MGSNAAVSVRGGMSGAAEERVRERPVRHLRVLPPAPRAYAVVAPPRGGSAEPAARSAVDRRGAGARRGAGEWPAEPGLPPLRLTARGRRLVVVLVLLLALGVVSLAGAVLGGGGDGLELMGTTSVVVEPGDTLWSIASAAAEGRDVREVVDGIQELNDVRDSAIVPGQLLHLP